MKLSNKRVLITGATGGIGCELAMQLAQNGCELVLSGRNESALSSLAAKIKGANDAKIITVCADIIKEDECTRLISEANEKLGGLDILINLAGLQTFKPFVDLSAEEIEQQIAVNLHAPIMLSKQAVILMQEQGAGQIVNIGSTFGSIAFANFSVYSATKFGLRGFSEALRRELKGSGISVNYIAPRATSTSMNSNSVYKMVKETGMKMDSPCKVATEIIKAITNNKNNHIIGFSERVFARINSILPNLMDKALYKQNLTARKYV